MVIGNRLVNKRKENIVNSFTATVFLLLINTIFAQDLYQTENNQNLLNENIEYVSRWSTSGKNKSVYVSNNLAYVTDNNKLEIIDISDPITPNLVGQLELNTSFLCEDIFGKDNQIYIANYKTIYLLNVSDPSNPDTVSSFDVGIFINDIYIVDNTLYAIASYDFYIFDISNPNTITQIGKLKLPDASLGLTRFHVQDNYAYIGTWSDGLYIVDISDLENPELNGRFLETSYLVFAQGLYAYVADARYIYILDITDKIIPDIVDRINSIGIPHDIYVDDYNIYVSTDNGVVIYKKDDLSFVASYSLGDVGERLQIENELIYVASNFDGMNILKYGEPSSVTNSVNSIQSFKLEQNYPNPFNPSTTIKYQIPKDVRGVKQEVRLKIFDILGREVATLVNKEQKAGSYEVEFNASSATGGELTSGIYFYTLTIGKYRATNKMLLIK